MSIRAQTEVWSPFERRQQDTHQDRSSKTMTATKLLHAQERHKRHLIELHSLRPTRKDKNVSCWSGIRRPPTLVDYPEHRKEKHR